MIDVNKIIVVDDFFPKWLQDSIDQQIKEYKGWKISDVLSPFIVDGKQGQEWFCTRVLYEPPTEQTEELGGLTRMFNDVCTMDGIFKAIPDAQIKACLRIRLNGTFRGHPVYPHEDSTPEQVGFWSILYYVNECDGGTRFYHDKGFTLAKEVPFKKGRAVIFPGCYYHNAMEPLEHNVRISVALLYVIDTKLNSNLYLDKE